jgi:ABC-type antimicrobial peptide transport system permease subunit
MALGADAGDVQRLIVRQTLRPIVMGMVVGTGAAAGAVRLLQSMLFGISPYDPIAFIGAPLLMLATAAAAALVPIRRAARVNPMSILRYE